MKTPKKKKKQQKTRKQNITILILKKDIHIRNSFGKLCVKYHQKAKCKKKTPTRMDSLKREKKF